MSLHIVPMESKYPVPYVTFGKHMSPPDVAEIIRVGQAKQLSHGQIGGTADEIQTNLDYRNVLTSSITYDDAPWLFERMVSAIASANRDFWSFDINGLFENMNFLQYDAPDESQPKPGKYDWHQDIGNGFSSLRKISTVTFLSDPKDYEGGQLHIFSQADDTLPEQNTTLGSTVMFPSYLPHCVTPITKGRRMALVGWVTGPAFR